MKGIYFDGKKAVFREDYPMPQVGPGHSLIRILVSAVCNTDKEILKGYRPNFKGIMGHEFVGVVEESDQEDLIGKRVVGELNEGCGHCLYCRSVREKHCPERKVIGMEKLDGCFAQYMVLATHLIHVVPEELPTEVAVFTESLAAALEIPAMLHLNPVKNVAVLGDGRLAFMITQVVALTGTCVTVFGRHEEKLLQFRPYGKTVMGEEAGGETFEVVIDATGSPQGINQAAKIVRKSGTIVLKSTYAATANLDMSYFVVNEITIMGSRCGPFEPALNLLQKNLITLPAIELYSLEEFEKAFSSKAFKAGFAIYEKD